MLHRNLTLACAALLTPIAVAHDGDPKLLDRQPAYQGPGYRNAARAALLGTGSTGGALAQGGTSFARSNVTLLAWLPLSDFGLGTGSNGNSCFGYVSPSGREYALFGHSAGTAVVEITQPGNPVIVGQISGPNSLWRDVRVYGQYAYAASEGGSGVQVLDLSQVDQGTVTLANTILTGGEPRTHTLELNVQSGRLYRSGGPNNGLRIYDVAANPASPIYLGGWFDRYVHEAQVVTYPTGGPGGGPRELAICCGGLNGGWADTGIDIVDVTNAAAPVHVAHIPYGSPGYSHQAWLSPDRQVLFHNDETDNRPYTRVFDASNLNSATPTLTYLGEFQNGVTVDHNLYTRGSLVFECNYKSGIRVFDTTSGVTTPTLHAWFDTYPESDDAGYAGLWNNYPYFPSGVVIGSDLQRGLFVWWVGTPQIELSFPAGTPALLHPAGQTVVVRVQQNVPGILAPQGARFGWTAGGAWTQAELAPLGGDLYAAVFPPLPCGSEVSWYVQATGTNGIAWTAPEEAPADVLHATVGFGTTPLVDQSFELGAGGFARDVATDTATGGLWINGDPVGSAAQPEDDHTAAPGTQCWFTGQGQSGGAIGAADVDTGRTTLLSPLIDLSGRPQAIVRYWRWYVNDGNTSVDDSFRVDASSDGGVNWTNVETLGPGHPDASGGWNAHSFRAADVVPVTSQFRLRFVAEDLGAGSIVEAAIDDLAVTDLDCDGFGTFCAGDGSATPCPCGNAGQAGAGCAHSGGMGARLAASGAPSVAADTFVLDATLLPGNVPVLFFQGTAAQNGGLGAVFGDGLRCAAGNVVRLASKTASAAAVSHPTTGEPPLSTHAGVGLTRHYQVWYRNAASFCTSDTFNLSNGVSAVWGG
jgi:choice-of-anchor B domain-containing protein